MDGVLDTVLGVIVLIVSCGAILLAIIAGVWTALMSKFEDKVDCEVNRRVQNMKVVTRCNVRFNFFEDPLGHGKMQTTRRAGDQARR